MLTAIPREQSRHLNPFLLALRLVEQQRVDIPPDLEEYFNAIVEQVRTLLEGAPRQPGAISPEAIALLLEIRAVGDLRTTIETLPGLRAIPPEIAHNILSSMEQRFAFQD
ncbi:MAG: hypothetical protein IKE66_06670 [Hyphomicrobium sp.]|nr:hypothetical protein [Hyphomicrobium sp.]